LLLQKREQQGDHWSPKFFAPAHDMEVLPGEETPEAVPLWAWNGKYSEAKQQPEVQEWEGESSGLLVLAAYSDDALAALRLRPARARMPVAHSACPQSILLWCFARD
jgi:hypothetical protein